MIILAPCQNRSTGTPEPISSQNLFFPGPPSPKSLVGIGMKSPNRESRCLNVIPDLAVSWLRKLRRVFTTGVPHFTVLSFIVLLRDCVCHKAKVGGNPSWSEGSGAISPTAFVHFLSLGHIWVVLTGFQTSSLSLHLLW